MLYIVEVGIEAENLAHELSQMRTWLDHMKFQAIGFRQIPGRNTCRVDFQDEQEAMAFAQALIAPKAAVHNQAFNVGPGGENYQVRDLAGIVNELLPQATVEYVGKNPDPRNYRVSFDKILGTLPGFQPTWNASRGARQLLEGYRAVGLTAERFQGPSYTRLLHLKALLASDQLDGSLRWRTLVAA